MYNVIWYKFIFSDISSPTRNNNFKFNLYFRSTNAFAVDISNCGYGWNRLIEDTFPDNRQSACLDLEFRSYNVDQIGRYARFVAISHYGLSPSLAYFHVDFEYPTSVDQDEVLCPCKFISLL